jgi:hypothetical protein
MDENASKVISEHESITENDLKRASKCEKRYSNTSKLITIVSVYTAIWVTKAPMNLNNRKSLNPVSVVAGSDQFQLQLNLTDALMKLATLQRNIGQQVGAHLRLTDRCGQWRSDCLTTSATGSLEQLMFC